MENEPIYTFPKFKEVLSTRGYIIGKAQGYRVVDIVDVDIHDLRNNITFSDNGIFIFDEKTNSEQQIFLYKRDYHLNKYGKPRFHIRECSVIKQFMSSGRLTADYRRANTDKVMVRDMDDYYKDKQVTHLPLCQYCAQMANVNYNSTVDFVEILKKAEEDSKNPTNEEVDMFGYTRTWPEISQAYRETKNYTCERCHVYIENRFDRQYIHVHHRNGNKLDNSTQNLECLCIRCHAEVDTVHKTNFSSKANQIIISDFNSKYPDPRTGLEQNISSIPF